MSFEDENIEKEKQEENNEPLEVVSAEPVETVSAEPLEETVEVKFSLWKEILDWGQAIVIAVILALIIRNFIFTLVVVEGPSMDDTLHTSDRLFVNRFFYTPENGDIIVFTPKNFPKKPFIKRVIATEGQTINIDYKTGDVTVDGKVLNEPYIKVPTTRAADMKFPQTVPEGCIFVMGDNRGNSHDSRNTDVGMVTKGEVMGHALFRFWPFAKFGVLK